MPFVTGSRVARWSGWKLLGGRLAAAGSPPSTVTFPTTQLVTRVMIALGADLTQPSTTWSWADITDFVRQDMGISWSTGRPEGSGQVGYGRAQLKLDNRDGRFSRRNPNSPYFGLLTRNTPIWVTVDAGSGVRDRIQMFVNEWPVRWSDESATDSTVTIQCSGSLRRLGQAATLKSAMRRAILSAAQPVPVAYWPMEDGTSAAAVASGLVGGAPMSGGAPTFGAAFGGSTGSLDFSGLANEDSIVGTATLTSANGFQIEFMVQSSAATLLSLFHVVSGTYNQPVAISAGIANGQPWHIGLRYAQNGSNVDVSTYVNGVFSSTNSTAAVLSNTVGIFIPGEAGTAVLLAHVVIYDITTANDPTTRGPAARAYAGESATNRIRRVCAEERVPVLCTSGMSVAMGEQPVGTLLDIVRDAEAVDQGVLYETAWGLGFQACNDRTNMPISLALDYNQHHIADLPEPADDDQRLRNRWTVSRTSGSSYVKELTTGQTGTTLAGVYDGSETVNVQTDSQLDDQAGWRLNVGTVDEDRWPTIPLNFTRNPTLIDTWTTLPFGQRMTVSNLPVTQVPPDALDLVIEGFSEAWTPFNWFASLNASPFAPYRVGTLAQDTGDTSTTLLILTPDTLTLTADVSTTDTSWSIDSSPLWTTAAESFPRNVMWEGELITVTNCTGVVVDAFARSTSNGWGTADAGGSWSVSGTASDYGVNGAQATVLASASGLHLAVAGPFVADVRATAQFLPGVVATGADFDMGVVLRAADANNYWQAEVRFQLAGALNLRFVKTVAGVASSVANVNLTDIYGSTSRVNCKFEIAGNDLRAKAWNIVNPEPGWLLTLTDSSLSAAGQTGLSLRVQAGNTNLPLTVEFESFEVTDPQTWTVTRSVNGVVKAHTANSTGRVYRPGVLALA